MTLVRMWIADKLYDTATAPIVASVATDGLELTLHRKKSGSFFVYRSNGDGEESISPVSYDAALDFLARAYGSEAQRILGESMPNSATVTLRGEPAVRLNTISSRTGKSKVEVIGELIARFGGKVAGITDDGSDTHEKPGTCQTNQRSSIRKRSSGTHGKPGTCQTSSVGRMAPWPSGTHGKPGTCQTVRPERPVQAGRPLTRLPGKPGLPASPTPGACPFPDLHGRRFRRQPPY